MSPSRKIECTYFVLMLCNTLAGSFIWGINTLFLLDAGLSNLQAFAANAFFTAGMVVFEVPTGIVADTWGRRTSYLLGTVTLAISTLLYWVLWTAHGPFWAWAVVSMLLGLGFTFFSGAVEAWLVDALEFTGYEGDLEVVLGRGEIVSGIAMLGGSLTGGLVAQATSLGVPFLLRTGVLAVTFCVAFVLMKDLGFQPDRSRAPIQVMRVVFRESIEHGLKNRPVRWVMLAAPFAYGAGFYAFYAVQPHLLVLHGDPNAYAIAGLAAALVAGTQIVGGWAAPKIRQRFRQRTTALVLFAAIGSASLVLLGLLPGLWTALVLVAIWGMAFAADGPVRQAYINEMIPSKQRATVLSFDSLMGSSGGVVVQPSLGRVADIHGYPASFLGAGIIAVAAIPFLVASRREGSPADFSIASKPGDSDARA